MSHLKFLPEQHIIQKLTSVVLVFSPKENGLLVVTREEKFCGKQALDGGCVFHFVFWFW